MPPAPPRLTEFAAVLVDLDGTLVNSDAPVRRVWTAFADRHRLDAGQVLHFAQGRPARETARRLAPEADGPSEARNLEEAELSDTDGVLALPGALALLTSPLTLAIVTSCTRRLAAVRLEAAGLPVPATMVCSDEVSAGKPDPECFLLGARRLGVEPGACAVLEDAPAGIAAGISAGATVIALRTTHADAELADAHVIVDDLAALAPLGA